MREFITKMAAMATAWPCRGCRNDEQFHHTGDSTECLHGAMHAMLVRAFTNAFKIMAEVSKGLRSLPGETPREHSLGCEDPVPPIGPGRPNRKARRSRAYKRKRDKKRRGW